MLIYNPLNNPDFVGVMNILNSFLLAMLGYIYWRAFFKMKKSKIIGWLAFLGTVGSICSAITGWLFISGIVSYTALAVERVSLCIALLGFIVVTLDPNQQL